MQHSTRPHMIIQNEEYFASGSRCNRRLVGYSHARYPLTSQLLAISYAVLLEPKACLKFAVFDVDCD